MHKETKKEFDVVKFLGYSFCVEGVFGLPVAWFASKVAAKSFVEAQLVPNHYSIVDCNKETN